MDSSNKAVRERKQFLNAAINKAAPVVRRANVLHIFLSRNFINLRTSSNAPEADAWAAELPPS